MPDGNAHTVLRAHAARAFVLGSLLTAVTNFYRELCKLEERAGGTRPGTSSGVLLADPCA